MSRSLFRTAVSRVRALAAAALFILAQASAWAQSPEMQDILNQISGEFRRTQGERLSQNCDYTAIDIAKQALQRAGFTNMAAGPVVIGALESACKAALSATGAGLAADAYSLSKCVYEYYTTSQDARALVMCLGVEAGGIAAGKLVDWLDVDPVTGAMTGQVFDRIGDDLKAGGLDDATAKLKEGEIRDFVDRMKEALVQVQRQAREKAENESPEPIVYTGFAYGCTVTIISRFAKAKPPTRGPNSVSMQIAIRDCECYARAPRVGKPMKEASIYVTVPVSFTPGPGNSPSWTADLGRMRTRIRSVCCDGTTSGVHPPGEEEGGATGTGAGTTGGTGATGTTGGTPTQPDPPPPPPPAPPKPPPTLAERCPECAPIIADIAQDQADIESAQGRIDRADEELRTLRNERADLNDEIDRAQQTIRMNRNRISLPSGGAAGGPQVANTLTADGVKVTTTTYPDGRVETRESRTGNRDIDAARDRITAARAKLKDLEQREAAARQRREAAAADKAQAEAKLRADQVRLEKCEEECRKRISTPPPPPVLVVPGTPTRPALPHFRDFPRSGPGTRLPPHLNPFRDPVSSRPIIWDTPQRSGGPVKPLGADCPACEPAEQRWKEVRDAWFENAREYDAIRDGMGRLETILHDFEGKDHELRRQSADARQALATLHEAGSVTFAARIAQEEQRLASLERAIQANDGVISQINRDLAPWRAKLKANQATHERLWDAKNAAMDALAACNREHCKQVSVTVDTVVGITGTNPFNPDDPTGTPTGPQPPPPGAPGTIQIGSASYSANEGQGVVVITVNRTGGASGAASVRYATGQNSAIAGADYQSASGTLAWADGEMGSRSFSIGIIDDNSVEDTEGFSVTLSAPTGAAALGSPATAQVSIVDNDGAAPQPAGGLQFSASSYSTAEGQGTVTLTVLRTRGAGGAVSVRYITVSGTAGGSDFGPASGILSWADGDTSAKSFTVGIVDDTLVEGTESFGVQLSNPTGGATLEAPATATVSIADNDTSTGACGPSGNAWQVNSGTYTCFGNCDPCPTPQRLSVDGNRITITPFHAGGAATFTGCTAPLTSDSNSLTYFGQANHRATLNRSSNTGYSAAIQSSGGGSCTMSCIRTGP